MKGKKKTNRKKAVGKHEQALLVSTALFLIASGVKMYEAYTGLKIDVSLKVKE